MILLKEPDWDSNDGAALQNFLRTRTGERMLAKLAYARPAFMPANSHPHKSFACSREIHGYEQAVKTLLGLIEAEDQPLSSLVSSKTPEYPDLDDDSQWTPEIPVT